ncbi:MULTISPECIES: hypothetical protein [unclassified Archaeoglobus]|jgi:hypothetical protein|uniref:hypothetical protein n=1 Tax=unclassified Archaeoglobus TaxID=2643606 RepID=UPI0025BC9F96|nr:MULTISPECIES: hypothetical protein [unclassified Archaeoglobus]
MKRIVIVLLALVILGSMGTAMSAELKQHGRNENLIKLRNGYVVVDSANEAEIVFHGEKYRMIVSGLGGRYTVKIMDLKGTTLWKGTVDYNPIAALEKGEIGVRGLPIPPDANINIYPDKYTYHKGEEGRVTIDVENGGVSIGFTSYFILIPENVDYNGVLDGPEPTGEIQLTDENDCWIVPEYGLVCGKGTLLVWQAVHLSGYKKQVVLSVTYNNAGSYEFEAGTAVVDGIIGWGDSSSDSFTVRVNAN